MNDLAVDTQELRKIYGDNLAVKGLTLQVKRGEVFGFLGPNGAGKTTSIKMLLGLVKPTSGSGSLLGRPIGDMNARAKVGFLPEHFRFHEWLKAEEFLQLHGRLYGMNSGDLHARNRSLMELVGLTGFAQKQLRTFSKGMLQRVGLAQALLNRPDLVFLDEPTSGLDPAGRKLVRDIIRQVRSEGVAVFLNSHLLSEVEVTCDRVAFIKHGEVVRLSDLKSLAEGEQQVRVQAENIDAPTIQKLRAITHAVSNDGADLIITLRSRDQLPDVNAILVNGGAKVFAFIPQRLSLEELFLQVVGEDGGL